MNLILDRLDAAELSLIVAMPHIDPYIKADARRLLCALIGNYKANQLIKFAAIQLSNVNTEDATLYAGAQS